MSNLYLIDGGKMDGANTDIEVTGDELTGIAQEDRGRIKDHNTRQQEFDRACYNAAWRGFNIGLFVGILAGLTLSIILGISG